MGGYAWETVFVWSFRTLEVLAAVVVVVEAEAVVVAATIGATATGAVRTVGEAHLAVMVGLHHLGAGETIVAAVPAVAIVAPLAPAHLCGSAVVAAAAEGAHDR